MSADDPPRPPARAPSAPRAAPTLSTPRLAAGSRPADADEQPRPGGRRGPGPRSSSTAAPAAPPAAGRRSTRSSASSAASPTTRRCSSSAASPSAVFRTHEWAPRVLIANSNLVGKWATWDALPRARAAGPDDVRPDDRGVVDLHRDAGDPPGHVRDVRGAARASTSAGRSAGPVTLTAGLGGMGGAQPLAVTMNDGVCIAIEVDEAPRPAAPRDRLRRPPHPRPGRGARMARDGGRRGRCRCRSRSSATRPRSSPPGRRRASGSTSSPTRPRPTTRSAATSRPRSRSPTRRSCATPARLYQQRRAALDGRPRPRDPRLPARRAPSPSTTATTCAPRRRRPGVADAFDYPGFVPGVHPAAVLRGTRPVPLGGAVGRPGGHPADRPRDPRALPRRRGPPPLDRDGRGAGAVPGPARPDLLAGLRRAGEGRPRVQPSSSRRARSARRSSSDATTSTPAPSPRPTARRRRWPTARTRSPTGRCSTPW